MKSPWLRSVLTLCIILLVAALIIEVFTRLTHYADSLIHEPAKQPLRRLVMADPPPWLSKAILNSLAKEAVDFAINNKQHPEYAAQLRDPLNGQILSLS